MDKREKRRREFVVTGGDASKIFEPLEKAFNLIAVFVEGLVVFLRIGLVFAWRNTSKSRAIFDVSENFGSVVTPIG